MNARPPLAQLGRYRIVQVLGRGAMGVVYEGLDPRLGRAVAIKTILKGHLVDSTLADEYSARFEREAQAAARLNHPNIVTVFDFGEQDEVAYLVMEFIRGRELAQAFAAGEPFTLAQALRITAELLDALAYAHAQGVVHRDIKPANVMLDAAGHVKLTDFGVARLAEAGQDRTAPGTMVGTPSYMSPEQILGLAVGSRADLFAVGIILYQFLTTQRPFVGAGPFAVQKQIVHDDPMPPTQHDPSLPPVLDGIVARALSKSPEDRYQTAGDFAAVLREVLASESIAPTPTRPAAASKTAPLPDPEATVVDRPTAARQPATATLPTPAPDPAPARSRAPVPAVASSGPGRGVVLAAVGAIGALGLGAWFLLAGRAPAPALPAAPPTPAATAAAPPAEPAKPAAAPASTDTTFTAAPTARPTASAPTPAPAPASVPSARLSMHKPAETPRSEPIVAPSAARADARCSDLRVRMQLGEPLSPDNQAFFDKECKR